MRRMNTSYVKTSTLCTPQIPDAIVHYAARELMLRAQTIKVAGEHVLEISPAPLAATDLKQSLPRKRVQQIKLTDAPVNANGLAQRFKKLMGAVAVPEQSLADLSSLKPHVASLVLAPFVLDAADDSMACLAELPHWFSDEGVLLFATLSSGGLPELVNAQTEWLDLLGHWHNIMDVGARLQALSFGLPVLDVETLVLNYHDADTLWGDVYHLLPALQRMNDTSAAQWRARLGDLFDSGLRQISLEILYGQVWQPTAKKSAKTEHVVTLESLTSQLTERSYLKKP